MATASKLLFASSIPLLKTQSMSIPSMLYPPKFPLLPSFNSHCCVCSFSTTASVSQYNASINDVAGEGLPGRIGFLGLGIMGSPMARNLLTAGYDVTVWNRTKSKCDHLIDLGAKYETSPAEVASSCDVTFAMLADPESAVDVACGTNGAAEGMSPGKGAWFIEDKGRISH